jgi:hypothetical protein
MCIFALPFFGDGIDWESEREKIFFKKVKKYLESVGRMISFAAPKSRDGE